MKLLFLVSEDSYFCSHRLNLAIAAKNKGYQVAVATCVSHYQQKITEAGIELIALKYFHRSSLNPWSELKALFELLKIYRSFKPDIVHQVAIKPVIYGSLIAKIIGIKHIVNALGGLGFLFTDANHSPQKKLLKTIVSILLKFIFKFKNSKIILQNCEDKNTIIELGVSSENIVTIQGAGVNLIDYPATPIPASPPFIISCVSRMLKDKGIIELVEAARLLKKENLPPFEIRLYGNIDEKNPSTLSEKELLAWQQEGCIQWFGHCHHVAAIYQESHIAVLASYREGLPKSLLEAASCARPIVTTDVPGCRDVVEHGINGLLVPAKNSKELAKALQYLMQDNLELQKMGSLGRLKVEKLFSEEMIHAQTLSLYPL